MTVNSARTCLGDGVFADIHADGRRVVLTTEQDGRTTQRIVLSIAAAELFDRCVRGLRPAKQVDDVVKRLR